MLDSSSRQQMQKSSIKFTIIICIGLDRCSFHSDIKWVKAQQIPLANMTTKWTSKLLNFRDKLHMVSRFRTYRWIKWRKRCSSGNIWYSSMILQWWGRLIRTFRSKCFLSASHPCRTSTTTLQEQQMRSLQEHCVPTKKNRMKSTRSLTNLSFYGCKMSIRWCFGNSDIHWRIMVKH